MFLEHVNLTVKNLDRSIQFYREVFDFDVRWKGKTNNGKPAAHVGDDRCYIALFESESDRSGETIDYGRPGMNHFGFVVDDLDAAIARLRRAGGQPHAEMDYEPGRRCYFLDPDGIEVELVAY
ncbi:MAG: VOC family protein [Phycisphaerae bacterium]